MGIITDIIKGLPISAVQAEKITELEKELEELKSENADLKERVAKYESQPGENCPMCRKPTLTLKSSKPDLHFGFAGVSLYLFSCSSCGFEDEVQADSAGKAWKQMRGH